MKPLRESQLGQVFLLRLGENRWSPALERQLREGAPAGVLGAEPLPRAPEALAAFLARIARALPHAPFLAIRQEGGRHDSLRAFFPPTPSLDALADSSAGPAAARHLGELWGEALALLGLNTNFAPRLDLVASPKRARPGAAFVAERFKPFIGGLKRNSILACAKHFPGLGSAIASPRGGLAVSSKSMADLWSEDLIPFRKLLPVLPMILMSTAGYRAFDFDEPRPAFMSPGIVTGLLRVKLGYHGLAVAYGIESSQAALAAGQAAVQSLEAGCDILIVDEGESFEAARRAVKNALDSGSLPPRRIEEAFKRIRATQRRLPRPTGNISSHSFNQLAHRFEQARKQFDCEDFDDA